MPTTQLQRMEKDKGGRPKKTGSRQLPDTAPPKLADLGVTKD